MSHPPVRICALPAALMVVVAEFSMLAVSVLARPYHYGGDRV
jgi:hypothetical protein